MISKLIKLPLLKRIIPSLSLRILKLLKKNRGYFKINNLEMFLDFLDPIDREIILSQGFEKQEIKFLVEQIKINKINYFVDVGANCGYYSLIISNEISSIEVLAFEPNIEAFNKFSKSLKKNINLSKKIKLENFGLSNRDSKLEMQSMVKFGYAQTGGVLKENFNNKNLSFFANFKVGDNCINLISNKISIKIDVEGHEFNVLKGLTNILKNNFCILQIEIFDSNFENVNNFLLSMGYKKFYEIKKRANYFYKKIEN